MARPIDGPQPSRFYAVRSRVIVWVLSAPLAILVVAALASMLSAGSVPIAAEVVIGLALLPVLALVLRTILGLGLIRFDGQVSSVDHAAWRSALWSRASY